MANATNIYAAQWNNGNHYPIDVDEWRPISSYNIRTTAGWGYNNGQNWVTGIRFTLAKAASSLVFRWCTYGTTSGAPPILNYKIIAGTDAAAYHNATSATAADGTVSVSTANYGSNTLTVERHYAAGTYVLFLWTSKAAGTYNYAQIYAAAASGSGSYAMAITYEEAADPSTITVTGNVMGSAISIAIDRKDSSYTHTLTWAFAGRSGTIVTRTGNTAVTWTPDANTFGSYIPSASSGTLVISCVTYSGDAQIGSTQTATTTLNVPADAAPGVAAGWAALGYSNAGTAASGIAASVKGYSKVTVILDAGKITTKYGATLTSVTAAYNGVSMSGTASGVYILGTAAATSAAVAVTVTDSRGKTASGTFTIAINDYTAPSLNDAAAFRCNAAGTAAEDGAYYSARATAVYSSLGGQNSAALTAAIKASGGSYGAATTLVSGTASVLGGGLSATTSYVVIIDITDALGNTAAVEFDISTSFVTFNCKEGGHGAAFFKYAETDGVLDVGGGLRARGAVTADGEISNGMYIHNTDGDGDSAASVKAVLDALWPSITPTEAATQFRVLVAGNYLLCHGLRQADGDSGHMMAMSAFSPRVWHYFRWRGVSSVTQINAAAVVTEIGTSGSWSYRKWSNGRLELEYSSENAGTVAINTQDGSLYVSDNLVYVLPSIATGGIQSYQVTGSSQSRYSWAIAWSGAQYLYVKLVSPTALTSAAGYRMHIHIESTWA